MTSAAGADNPPPPPDDSAILPTDWRSAKDPQVYQTIPHVNRSGLSHLQKFM